MSRSGNKSLSATWIFDAWQNFDTRDVCIRVRVHRERLGLLEFEWKIFRIRRVPSLHANKSSPFHVWILYIFQSENTTRFFHLVYSPLLNISPIKIPIIRFRRDCDDFYIREFTLISIQKQTNIGRWKPMANQPFSACTLYAASAYLARRIFKYLNWRN